MGKPHEFVVFLRRDLSCVRRQLLIMAKRGGEGKRGPHPAPGNFSYAKKTVPLALSGSKTSLKGLCSAVESLIMTNFSELSWRLGSTGKSLLLISTEGGWLEDARGKKI